jgi:hypothetical protein
MNPFTIAGIVFGALFGAACVGLRLGAILPDHHLSADTKDAVRVGMATVGSMAALVLALLVASTKGSYDTEKNEVTQMAAKIIHLNRLLVSYGPEAAEIRTVLRSSTENAIDRMWPDEKSEHAQLEPNRAWSEVLPDLIHKLDPHDEKQRSLKLQLARLGDDIGQMRWLLFEQSGSSISTPMLVIMVFWLALTFISVGLFAPANATAILAQLLAALSVAGAIFLILELDHSFSGFIKISSKSILNALSQLPK